MNNSVCFSTKTANKHVNAIRRMFDANGTAYMSKLNSNLTPTSRAVRKTILTYMLEDNIITKVDDFKVKFNMLVDDPLLKEWSQAMHQHHINRKGLIKAAKLAKDMVAEFKANPPKLSEPTVTATEQPKHIEVKNFPAMAFSNFPGATRAVELIDKAQAAKLPDISEKTPYADKPGTLNNAVKLANEAVDAHGEHSIQKACDKLNEKPIHEHVEDLVFLTRREVADIVDAVHSLVYQVNFSIYGSRDPMHSVSTKHTAAGRLAEIVLRPLKVKA